MKLLLKIAYLGTAYSGYQVQTNGTTVQQKMNEAAHKVFGFPCDIVGCSRTDSGVHANEFCLTVSEKGKGGIEFTIPADKIPKVMNIHLPDDISVLDASLVDEDFHPRYHVAYKEYIYRIHASPERDPFLVGRAYQEKKPIDDALFQKMQKAAAFFCGEHDFSAFMAAGWKVTSTTVGTKATAQGSHGAPAAEYLKRTFTKGHQVQRHPHLRASELRLQTGGGAPWSPCAHSLLSGRAGTPLSWPPGSSSQPWVPAVATAQGLAQTGQRRCRLSNSLCE